MRRDHASAIVAPGQRSTSRRSQPSRAPGMDSDLPPLPAFPRIDRSKPSSEDRAAVIAYLNAAAAHLHVALLSEANRSRLTVEQGRTYARVLKQLPAVEAPTAEGATRQSHRFERNTKQLLDVAATVRRLLAAAVGDPTQAEYRTGHVGRPPAASPPRQPTVRWAEPRPLTAFAHLVTVGTALFERRFDRETLLTLCTPDTLRAARRVGVAEIVHARDALPSEVRAHWEWLSIQQREGVDPRTAMYCLTGARGLSPRDRKRLDRWQRSGQHDLSIAVGNVGQRRAYRMLPILQALALVAYLKHRSAPHVQVGRAAWALLVDLVPQAEALGMHLLLTPYRPRATTSTPAAQLTLPLGTADAPIHIAEPAPRTFARFLESLPEPIRYARVHGIETFIRQQMPRDGFWQADAPNEYWEVDSTPLDLMVAVDLQDRTEEIAMRLYLTVVQDVYSRLVVGYYLWVEPVTSYSVRCALYSALRPAPALGRIRACRPTFLRADLGSEHTATETAAFLEAVGVTAKPCNARSPNERFGERFLGTLKQRLSTLPGYTKHPGVTAERLRRHPEQLLPFRDALAAVDTIIHEYNTTPHAQTREMPLARWQTGSEAAPPPDDDLILHLLRSNHTATLGREGVRFQGVDYRGDLTLDGRRTMLDYVGRKVRLFLPPPPVDFLLIALTSDRADVHVPERILGRLYPPGGAPRITTDEQVAPGVRTLKAMLADAQGAMDPRTRRPTRAIPPVASPTPELPASKVAALPAPGAAPPSPRDGFDRRLAAARVDREARRREARQQQELESLGDLTDFTITPGDPRP